MVRALGFDEGFFNVEFFIPSDGGAAQIIEVNARISSQFWPLVEAVDGQSTYEALFELACGGDPAWAFGPPRGVAISNCIRVFEDAFVRSVPDPEPGLELLVRPGLRLSQQGRNDEQSFRLAIFDEFAETRAAAVEQCLTRAKLLRDGFELDPVAVGARR